MTPCPHRSAEGWPAEYTRRPVRGAVYLLLYEFGGGWFAYAMPDRGAARCYARLAYRTEPSIRDHMIVRYGDGDVFPEKGGGVGCCDGWCAVVIKGAWLSAYGVFGARVRTPSHVDRRLIRNGLPTDRGPAINLSACGREGGGGPAPAYPGPDAGSPLWRLWVAARAGVLPGWPLFETRGGAPGGFRNTPPCNDSDSAKRGLDDVLPV